MRDYPQKKNKYRKGGRVYWLTILVRGIEDGDWFYFNDKPMSPHFLTNWSLHQLQCAVKRGQICRAIENKESEE